MILLFLHGWAFDRTLWRDVIGLLPRLDCRLADRGYFGAPAVADCSDDVVAVTHSLGTMHLLAAPPPHCRGLVAINGFDRFCAAPGFPGVPRRVVDRMAVRMAADASAVVNDFRARCGMGGAPAMQAADVLAADLALLRDGDCREQASRWQAPLVLLDAHDDPILPAALRGAAFGGTPGARRIMQERGGHLLPVTLPGACAAAISELVESLG
ncbi:MAG: alpha/beta hydrolase [Pseudomonadota bacterium]